MAKQNFTTAATVVEKEISLVGEGGQKQIREFFFPIKNQSLSAGFDIGRFLQDTYAASYRNRDTQGHIRNMPTGEKAEIYIPQGTERTPLTEKLRDSINWALDKNASFEDQQKADLNDTIEDHIAAWNMRHNKQCFEMFIDGKFHAPGEEGDDIGLDINYGKTIASTLDYDATDPGASFSEMMIGLDSKMNAGGVPRSKRYAFLGGDWDDLFSSDTVYTAWMDTKPNIPDLPDWLIGFEGLDAPVYYKVPGMRIGIWLCWYEPGIQYKASKDASEEPWIPTNQIVAGSHVDKRYDVDRVIALLSKSGNSLEYVVGDVAFDEKINTDLNTIEARSHVRKGLVPARVDRMYNVNGTFPA